ncbi:MAG: mannan-binding lectin [Planctomycetota bacterium]|nr:mannan-binding lectin [Planctomycetota bacterium]
MKRNTLFFLVVSVFAASAWGAAAGERCDLVFLNSLDEEIVSIHVKYSTPHEETRDNSSRVCLPPGQDWRVGVQGAILPEQIILELATKTYDFSDLSDLNPDSDMRLEAAYEDDQPILRRLDPEGRRDIMAAGLEYDFLTAANRPNAVDRDFLTDAKSWEEVVELVEDAAKEAREEFGELRSLDIEAGPIRNHEFALSRCPEAAAEWNGEHGGAARWTGQWTTTIPGKMSVCTCLEGTAEPGETMFLYERPGWGAVLGFPVFWKQWFGVARVQAIDSDSPEEGIGIRLSFRIADGGETEEMLEELLDDLRVDGFRPWSFRMEARDEEKEEPREVELDFHQGAGDKYYDQDEMQWSLFAAYADSSLSEAVALWVREDAFKQVKAGEEPEAGPGVAVLFSRGTFEAVFVPDGRELMR